MDYENLVKASGNTIWFYDEVNASSVLEAVQLLKTLNETAIYNQITNGVKSKIQLRINSPGGGLFDGFALANYIEQLETEVVAYGEGIVASAATLPYLACRKRHAGLNCQFLIHSLTSQHWETLQQIQDNVKMLEDANEQLVDFYCLKTKLKKKQIKEIMKSDSWLNWANAKQYGIVTEE